MAETYTVLIIGAGQAGLACSYFLKRAGIDHLVLEQGRVGETWRSRRWDSFTLVTLNLLNNLPGLPHGHDPSGFMARDELVAYLEEYTHHFDLPVRTGVKVFAVEQIAGEGYRVFTDAGEFTSPNVIIATGAFPVHKTCSWRDQLPGDIYQINSEEYRNSQALPPGGVLVVGSAQTGVQLAEELNEDGRRVYLAVGSATRVPRRYRGKDCNWWLMQGAAPAQTVSDLPSPRAKFGANPHVSGKNGGHDLNLRQLEKAGVVLLGHLQAAREDKIFLAPDLEQNLAKADQAAARFKQMIDQFVLKNGLDEPEEKLLPEEIAPPPLLHPPILELDLRATGVTTVIWATGYTRDFSWVKIPVFDEDDYPLQQRGVTAFPGLYFISLPWLYRPTSSIIYGVTEDAEHIINHLAGPGR